VEVEVDLKDELLPYTRCENSWWDGVTGVSGRYERPCITVDADADSMRGYSVSGFGMNFCGENKEQFTDKLSTVCFWGSIGVTVPLSIFGTTVASAVVVPVVIDSAAIGCEKLSDMVSRWPHSQY
jgi:hypothetical protein